MLREKDQIWANDTLEKIKVKMSWLSEKSADKIPYLTKDGVHQCKRHDGTRPDDGIQWWTNGFWGGLLWQMFHETKQDKYAEIARKSEVWLDECFENFYGLHHDVGFMWLPTAVADYRLTGNEESRKRGLHAANLLAGRFNPVGEYIRAWDEMPDGDVTGWAIIDCMFNIPLLYWASEETKDPRFKHIALIHANKVMENFIRPDGSVAHIVEFDPETGEKVREIGGQGYADDSSWTRGQTWALYGFMISYIRTGKQEFLDTAKRVAHYFIANIPEDGLIPVDFRQPANVDYEDSIAAAVAACGLIEISKAVNEREKEMYLQPALKMLKALDEKRCDYSENKDSFLNNCTAAYYNERHRHVTMVYGDYYYIEALLKLKGDDFFIW